MEKSPGRSIAIGTCAVLGSLAVGLIGVELGLRALGIGHPWLMQRDLVRGDSLLPDAEGWLRREGEAYVKISDQGLRDEHYDFPHPPNAFRVAVLGDSFTEAMQVDQQDAFPTVIERELRSCSAFQGQTIEVLNFGISGHGTSPGTPDLAQRGSGNSIPTW